MKIGILTQPLTNNYGGILQNYAMQQILNRLGHEPITVRIAHGWQNMSTLQFLKEYPKYFIFHLLQKIKGRGSRLPVTIWKWRKQTEGIEKFIKKNIKTTPFVNGNSLEMKTIYTNNIDLLLVGSDQVWHGGFSYMNHVYFCGFAKDNVIKRISYAASFGFDKWRGSEEQTLEAKDLIQKFNAISVREAAGVELCKTFLDRNDAKWVLDPTLLLEKKDYIGLCNNIPVKTECCVFAYILDMSDEKKKLVEEVAKRLDCKVQYLGVVNVTANDSIENWLSMFRDAKFIVTDSYHGTVFSLIFKKDFLCVYNPNRGNSRMDSLKKITSLDDRFICDSSAMTTDSINYDVVNERIEKMRIESLSFLKDALN